MTVNEVLPVILYILGAILLTCLIVLTVKLIITMNKVEKIVDNITDKVSTLDKVFEIIVFTIIVSSSTNSKSFQNFCCSFKSLWLEIIISVMNRTFRQIEFFKVTRIINS